MREGEGFTERLAFPRIGMSDRGPPRYCYKNENKMTPKETQQTAIEILKTLSEQITDNDATHGELLGTVIKMLRAVEKKLPE